MSPLARIRRAPETVRCLWWRATNSLSDWAETRRGLRLACFAWWHRGIGPWSFAAGAGFVDAATRAPVTRWADAAVATVLVWAVGELAASVHAIAWYAGQHDGEGCPMCPTGGDGDDGPEGGEPVAGPDDPEDPEGHGRSWPPASWTAPDFFADFEAEVSQTPAIREQVRS